MWNKTITQGKWSNHLSHLPLRSELIQQLLAPGEVMMIAGQFGMGKTNELLHLMYCFCHGADWHGLHVEPKLPLYIAFEGSPEKINSRISIIEPIYSSFPKSFSWYFRFQTKPLLLDTPQGRNELERIITELDPQPQAILIDPFKRAISKQYSKPEVADAWIAGINSLALKLECTFIISAHTNKIIYRKDESPDELGPERVKGAGDILDGINAAILIAEEKGYRREMCNMNGKSYSRVVWSKLGTAMKVLKAKDATAEFPLLKLDFNREELRHKGQKWVLNDDGSVGVEKE